MNRTADVPYDPADEGEPRLSLGKHLKSAEQAGVSRTLRRRFWLENLARETAVVRAALRGPWAFLPIAVLLIGAAILIVPTLRGGGSGTATRMLLLVLAVVAGHGLVVLWRARRAVKRELAAARGEPGQSLALYYNLGWQERESAYYLLTPDAAKGAELETASRALMHWKRFRRKALKEAQQYMEQWYDLEAFYAAGHRWEARLRLRVKKAEVSRSGTKARAYYRIGFPDIVTDAADMKRFLVDRDPTLLYELEGAASFVKTADGTWLMAEGPVDPVVFVEPGYGLDAGDLAF